MHTAKLPLRGWIDALTQCLVSTLAKTSYQKVTLKIYLTKYPRYIFPYGECSGA